MTVGDWTKLGIVAPLQMIATAKGTRVVRTLAAFKAVWVERSVELQVRILYPLATHLCNEASMHAYLAECRCHVARDAPCFPVSSRRMTCPNDAQNTPERACIHIYANQL